MSAKMFSEVGYVEENEDGGGYETGISWDRLGSVLIRSIDERDDGGDLTAERFDLIGQRQRGSQLLVRSRTEHATYDIPTGANSWTRHEDYMPIYLLRLDGERITGERLVDDQWHALPASLQKWIEKRIEECGNIPVSDDRLDAACDQ